MGMPFNFEAVLKIFVIVVMGLSLFVAAIVQFGASLYDLSSVRLRRRLQSSRASQYRRQRPLITVIVYVAEAHNATIYETLMSIVQGSYRKLEIVVVDPLACSRVSVASIRTRYPATKIVHTTSEHNTVRYVHGDLTLRIDGNVLLTRTALKDAQQLLAIPGHATKAYVATHPSLDSSVRSIVQRFRWLYQQPYSKLCCLLNINPDIYMAVLRMLQCVAVSYLLYVAIYLKSPQLYLLVWAITCGWFSLLLVLNETLGLATSLRQLAYVPLMYNILYITDTFQILRRTLLSFKIRRAI